MEDIINKSDIRKAFCNSCSGERNHHILFSKLDQESTDYGSYYCKYQIIQCLGCEYVHFLKECGEDDNLQPYYDIDGNTQYEHYPDIHLYPPKEQIQLQFIKFDSNSSLVSKYFDESVAAFNNDLILLSAIGLRACLERFCHYNEIIEGNLKGEIDKLKQKNIILKDEHKQLHGIRFLGNESAHEVLPQIKKKQIISAIQVFENIFLRVYNLNETTIHHEQLKIKSE